MAGIIIPILPKRRFDFSYLAANTSSAIILHSALNLIPFKSGRLLMRVHGFQHSGDGSLQLAIFGTAPCPDDTLEFTLASAAMSTTASSGSAAGDLEVDTDSDIPPFVKVVLVGIQDTSSKQTLYGELSADLVVRES